MIKTPLLGAGLCPAGLSPAGYGIPEQIKVDNRSLIKPDGEQGSSRLIVKGDYVLNEHGNHVGANDTKMKVYLALATVKGSATASPELGQAFSTLKVIGPNIQNRISEEVKYALSSLIDSGEIELISTVVQRKDSQVKTLITWKDLQTQELSQSEI